MIHDVDATLRALIERDVLNGPGVELSFDAPTKEWAAQAGAADDQRASSTTSARTRRVAMCSSRRCATRTAGSSSAASHRGACASPTSCRRGRSGRRTSTACSRRCSGASCGADVLPPDLLVGSLADRRSAGDHADRDLAEGADQFSEVWGALGGELRPSIHLAVIAPFDVSRSMPVGPPVTETPRISVVRPDDGHGNAATRQGRSRAAHRAGGRGAPVPALPDEVVRAGAEDEPGRVFRVRAMPERR